MKFLVEDLRTTIENITNGSVSISFHPMSKSSGNIWSIRGTKTNLIVMLHYQNQSRFADDEGTDAVSIKQETNGSVTMDPMTNVTDLGIDLIVSRVPSILANEERIPPQVADLTRHFAKGSNSSQCKMATWEKVSAVSNTCSSAGVDKCLDSQDYEQKSIPGNILQIPIKVTSDSHSRVTTDHNVDQHTIQYHDKAEEFQALPIIEESRDRKKSRVDDVAQRSVNFIIQCSHCGKIVRKAGNFNENLQMPYRCPDCNNLVRQMSDFNRNVKMDSQNDIFYCASCSVTFNELNCFYVHMEEKHCRCSLCDKKFRFKSHLERHKVIHSGEKVYECSQCTKKFNQKCHLQRHKLIHDGNKPYKCLQCGKDYCHKNHLERHRLVHSGEKPFKCPQCEKTFYQKSNLERHKLIHSGEKSYECPLCYKEFHQKSGLERHQLVHSGEKPYKCSQCEKKFNRKCNLQRHKSIHRGENSYLRREFYHSCHLEQQGIVHNANNLY